MPERITPMTATSATFVSSLTNRCSNAANSAVLPSQPVSFFSMAFRKKERSQNSAKPGCKKYDVQKPHYCMKNHKFKNQSIFL